MLNGFNKSDFLETALHLFPLITLLFAEVLGLGSEVLVKSGEENNLPRWFVDIFCQLLQKIEFLFGIVLGSMFENLAEFIYRYDEKIPLLTAFSIEAVERIEYAVAGLSIVQLALQEGDEVAVIAYNI